MEGKIDSIFILVNFFFLALALLAMYYYARRLGLELRRSNRLKQESDRYKALFNATSEGVLELDAEGRFVIINQGGARLLGYDDPQVLLSSGTRIQDFYIEPGEWKEASERVLSTRDVVHQIARMHTFHKGQVWIELTYHPKMDADNGIGGIEAIFRDVTERLAMQEELKSYSENLEKKIEEKTGELLQLERHKFNLEKLANTGKLVAQLVHELRNPLSSIKMGLSTLHRRAALKEEDGHIVDISLREVTHLERMLKELLGYARPDMLKFVPEDINEVLNQTVEQLQSQLDAAGCEVIRDLSAACPEIGMDRDRMGQVFSNLILNAQQASKAPGRIVIASEFQVSENRVRVEVRDSGSGIGSADIGHIFEPFYSRREGGTGLGLSIVRAITEAHGGEVTVESEPGKGTVMRIELPVR
ncbi:PAS domain S-box protein [bacterium]|nr:PAS domain S-box protein [bacterium]